MRRNVYHGDLLTERWFEEWAQPRVSAEYLRDLFRFKSCSYLQKLGDHREDNKTGGEGCELEIALLYELQ